MLEFIFGVVFSKFIQMYNDIYPLAQRVKNLPAVREIWVQSLSWEDPLEKEMATHSSTLARKIPWMEEPGSYSPCDRKELDATERLHFSLSNV